MTSKGFKPAIQATERLQTYALESTANRIGAPLSLKKHDPRYEFREILGICPLLHLTTCYPCKIKAGYFHFQPPTCSFHYYLPAASLFNILAVTAISGGRLLHQQIIVAALRVQRFRWRHLLCITWTHLNWWSVIRKPN